GAARAGSEPDGSVRPVGAAWRAANLLGRGTADQRCLGGSAGRIMSEYLPDVDLDAGIPDIAEAAPMDTDELGSVLEALLLVVDTPVTAEALAAATQQPVYRVATRLQQLADELTERHSGI